MVEGHAGPRGKCQKHEERGVNPTDAADTDTAQRIHPSTAKQRGHVLCEHQRQRSRCKDCGDSVLCTSDGGASAKTAVAAASANTSSRGACAKTATAAASANTTGRGAGAKTAATAALRTQAAEAPVYRLRRPRLLRTPAAEEQVQRM